MSDSFSSIINSLQNFQPNQALNLANQCFQAAKQLWFQQLMVAISDELNNLNQIVNLGIVEAGTTEYAAVYVWSQVMQSIYNININGDIVQQIFGINVSLGSVPTTLSGIRNLWANIYQSVEQFYETISTSIVDTAERAYTSVAYITSLYGNSDINSNGFVAGIVIPSVLNQLQLAGFDPSNQTVQQNIAQRNALLTLATQLYLYYAINNSVYIGSQNIVYAYQNQDLMDVSSAYLGSYQDYQTLVAGNPNLTSSSLLAAGQPVLVPPYTKGKQVTTNINEILGTDIYLAPTWQGNFYSISGTQNLSYALTRRLQTQIGTLIYEPTYGSRIPSEIGQVAGPQTAQYLLAFAQSAVLADPRVSLVNNATVTNPSPGLFTINMNVIANNGQGTQLSVQFG